MDYEIVFIFGLEDLWSLAKSSLTQGGQLTIKEESMCFRSGVLIVADSLSLRTCSLDELKGIINVSPKLGLSRGVLLASFNMSQATFMS